MAADKNRIFLFDTTLRDGEQSPGISLSTREKLEIADQLARLGMDVIEAGFPITSQGDFDAVSTIAGSVREPVIAALARVVEADIDRAAEALKTAAKPRIHTFVMSSDTQIEYQLRKTREEVLEMAVKAVERAKSYVDDVEFSPMDATRADFDFLSKLVEAAIDAGATVINIPDTVGYATPDEFGKLIADLIKAVPKMNDIVVSVHCHNDLGMSTANALAAIVNGAVQVEGTINGIGERAGNTALEEIAMILDTRRATLGKYTNINTEEISKTSRLVSSLTGYQVQFNKAIVGKNAFAHSSGIHQDGVLKDRSTFEIIDPKRVGISESSLILGKTSGRHAFRMHIESLGYQMNDNEFEGAFEKFKALADKKAEISDIDIEALLADEVRSASDVYILEYLYVSSGTDATPEARVRLRKNGDELIEKTATGDGQVDAACKAIESATRVKSKLVSLNINSITEGLDAQGDVSIQIEVDGKTVLGRGVSTDIVEASAKAYLNAINKAIGK
jgi:2-isopropylmalate synthase